MIKVKIRFFLILAFLFVNQNLFSQIKQIFYEDGKTLAAEGKMVNEKKEGIWTQYYQDGKTVYVIGNFVNDLQEGEFIYYYKDGKTIYSKTNYKNNKLNGSYIVYHTNGNVGVKANYVNDVEDGPFKTYSENGNLIMTKIFKNGVVIQELGYYPFGDKKLEYKINLNENGIHGKAFFYDEYGKGSRVENYVNNKKDGPAVIINSFGDKEIGDYLNDNKYGEWKIYDENENIKEIKNYNEDGELSGPITKFYFGHITKGEYYEGKKTGVWIKYDEYDNIFAKYTYRNGALVKSRYPTELYFKNSTNKTASLLIKYKNLKDEWKTEGWFIVGPGEKKLIRKAIGSNYYYYGEAANEGVWSGNQRIEFKGKYYPFKEIDFADYKVDIENNTVTLNLTN